MNCLEAQEGGCQWFLTDPADEQMVIQITRRAVVHRKQAAESATAGHEVQAGKHEVLARRAEAMEGEVLRSASQELRERMMAKKREIEEEFYRPEAKEGDDLAS
jgi:FixJ family two-component response regulator